MRQRSLARWMVRRSSGTLELLHYCPCQGIRTLLLLFPLTSPFPIHALPNEEPHLICLLSELAWFSELIGFPCECVIALKNNVLIPERPLYNEAGPSSLGTEGPLFPETFPRLDPDAEVSLSHCYQVPLESSSISFQNASLRCTCS